MVSKVSSLPISRDIPKVWPLTSLPPATAQLTMVSALPYEKLFCEGSVASHFISFSGVTCPIEVLESALIVKAKVITHAEQMSVVKVDLVGSIRVLVVANSDTEVLFSSCFGKIMQWSKSRRRNGRAG
jgi:hypothetical protein